MQETIVFINILKHITHCNTLDFVHSYLTSSAISIDSILAHSHVLLVFTVLYPSCLLCIGAVEPEVLIRYAHMISQASSVVSPLGWQPSELLLVTRIYRCVSSLSLSI